jgi:hypothetical protein
MLQRSAPPDSDSGSEINFQLRMEAKTVPDHSLKPYHATLIPTAQSVHLDKNYENVVSARPASIWIILMHARNLKTASYHVPAEMAIMKHQVVCVLLHLNVHALTKRVRSGHLERLSSSLIDASNVLARMPQ